MTSGHDIASDPFADPIGQEDAHRFIEDATLSVGRNASLTLGTDSLIVLGIAPLHVLSWALLISV